MPEVEVVEGEVSFGSGWWIELPQPFSLSYDDDDAVVLEATTMIVRPETFRFDASQMTDSVGNVARGIIADTVDDSAGRIASLGSLTGEGWDGSWCTGPAESGGDEFEIVASLGAAESILNLSISYLGAPMEGQAHWLVQHVTHRPETAVLTTQLQEVKAHLSVPSDADF